VEGKKGTTLVSMWLLETYAIPVGMYACVVFFSFFSSCKAGLGHPILTAGQRKGQSFTKMAANGHR